MLSAVLAAAALAADPAAELKKLEGTWEVAGGEVRGEPIPRDAAPKRVVISGDKLTGLGPDMTLRVDPTTTPAGLDLAFTKDGKARTVAAIYDLGPGGLTLGIPLAKAGGAFGGTRPAAFDTKDRPVMVIRLKRRGP